ncbi:MAG: nucleotidyltransferase [Saprospiraceae bacterium]|nr:nucleotidyltransferase [Saprospiraceae bacterium]
MNSIFNEDFLEYISLLNKHSVRYILIGGLAVNVYGYRRSTGDMDLWIEPTEENHTRLTKVHQEYGMYMGEMEDLENFIDTLKFDVFQFGGGFIKIDIMTACKGLIFESALKQAKMINIEKVNVRIIHINDLIQAKLAAGRFKDLDDIENLNKLRDQNS